MFSADDLDLDLDEVENLESLEKEKKQFETPTEIIATNVFRMPTSQHSIVEKTANPHPLLKRRSNEFVEPSPPRLAEKLFKQTVLRKFPGPAGLLPDKLPRSFNTSSILSEESSDDKRNENEPILLSQTFESAFSEPPFLRLKQDFELNKVNSPLAAFSVEWVRKKALGKSLKGRKVPFLAVVFQSIDCSSDDPVVTLRDCTGELCGALHREVWQDLGQKLKPGAAIALKQISVLSTGISRRHVLLNITMNNIVSVYSQSEDGEVEKNIVNPTTLDQLAKIIVELEARSQQSPASSPDLFTSRGTSPQTDLFQTVSTIKSLAASSTPTRGGSSRFGRLRQNGNPVRKSKVNSDKHDEHRSSVSDISNAANNTISNFDLFMDDGCFNDVSLDILSTPSSSPSNVPTDTSQSTSQNCHVFRKPLSYNSKESSSATTLQNNAGNVAFRQRSDVNNVMKTVESSSERPLSQAESNIVNEVLSGVDIDDFDINGEF